MLHFGARYRAYSERQFETITQRLDQPLPGQKKSQTPNWYTTDFNTEDWKEKPYPRVILTNQRLPHNDIFSNLAFVAESPKAPQDAFSQRATQLQAIFEHWPAKDLDKLVRIIRNNQRETLAFVNRQSSKLQAELKAVAQNYATEQQKALMQAVQQWQSNIAHVVKHSDMELNG